MTRISRGLKALAGVALATGLLTDVSLTSCKKTAMTTPAGSAKTKKSTTAKMDMHINLDEVYAALPATIMHNLSGQFKMDASHAEWIYEPDYLLVRIPLNDAVNKSYIYAAKYYNDPTGKPAVFLSQFIPDRGSNGNDFSGKQMWLNLQDWTFYGVQFEHNKAMSFMKPVAIDPHWESDMLDAGVFYLDANDKIVTDPVAMQILRRRKDPLDCPGNVNDGGKGGGLFGWLGGIFGDIVSGIGTWWQGSGDGEPAPSGGGDISGIWGQTPNTGLPGGDGGTYGGWSNGTPSNNPPIDVWGHPDGSIWASANNNVGAPVVVGGPITTGNANVDYLKIVLDLNAQQIAWLLGHNDKAHRMKAYMLTAIPALTLEDKKAIMKEHLERMRTDPTYFTFVDNYDQNNSGMWWMNDDWVNDLDHFELTPNSGLNTGIKATWNTLTAAEKATVKLYPVQAFIIFTRFGTAQDVAQATGLPGKTNGKQDAFCHAFFQAICVRDMVPRFSPTYMSRAQIVLLFSTAHESETPPQRILAKQMDLFNNSVGIAYGESVSIFALDNTIKNGIESKVANGELRYLTPVEPDPPNGENGPNNDFWSVNGNTQLGRHGILSTTQIVPTNQ